MSEVYAERSLRLRVEHDEDCDSPRDGMDNLGTMVCFHRRYSLGDMHDLNRCDFTGWDSIKQHLIEECAAEFVLPVYLLDHSRQSISTAPFWDSGQVGFIYCSQIKADKWFGEPASEERILAKLRAEVEVYDQWLNGDVWGYVVEEIKTCPTCGHTEYECIDSCYGFYGEKTAREYGELAATSLLKEKKATAEGEG